MRKNKIPIDPCSENWDTMTPTEQGKHCFKCDKIVHDVSNKSEKEIWKEHKANQGNMCIRIQADRVSTYRPWHLRIRHAAAAATLTLLLSIQQKIVLAQTDTASNKEDDNTIRIENMKITGVVLDSLSDENKVAFATIILFKNNKKIGGAFTNTEGRFELTATEEVTEQDKIHLELSQVGQTTFTKNINTLKDSIDCEIYCKEEHVCLKQVVIAMERKNLRGEVTIAVGKLPGGNGSMTGVLKSRGSRKILDDYDTKTFHHDEIERYNLGR